MFGHPKHVVLNHAACGWGVIAIFSASTSQV